MTEETVKDTANKTGSYSTFNLQKQLAGWLTNLSEIVSGIQLLGTVGINSSPLRVFSCPMMLH